jgi:XTP/dITP diphosphohydrolase
MKPTLLFATNNAHKLAEAAAILHDTFEVVGLSSVACTDELPEEQDTLEGNALQKARYVYDKYGVDCFADDTGLEVDALGGEPGVYSARYAGAACVAADNMEKLLTNLRGKTNRNARFRTVIALILKGQVHLFEGIVNGQILDTKAGVAGFGYDPIFQPEGYTVSFAEMDSTEKNSISHRGRALQKMSQMLSNV